MANPPQMPQTFFADGNASLVRLGAALGAAVVFGAGAFAPAQPKPQVAHCSQGDRTALLIASQGSAQVFHNTATTASQPKVRERGLIFAQPQYEQLVQQTPLALVFKQPRPSQPKFSQQWLYTLPQNPTQTPAFLSPLPPPSTALSTVAPDFVIGTPQADPSYYAAVTFTWGAGLYPVQPVQQPAAFSWQQRALDQPAASVFSAPPGVISVAPGPSPDFVVAQALQDPTQPAPLVFGRPSFVVVVQSPPLRGAIIGQPQADPSQPSAIVSKQPPANTAPTAGPIPAPPSIVLAEQDKTQPAAQVFSRMPPTAPPPPLMVADQAAPQFDPSMQLAASVFKQQPAPSIPPTPQAAWWQVNQRSLDQIPAQVFFRKPLTVVPPPLQPAICVPPQFDPGTQLSAIFAHGAEFYPKQPTPTPAEYSWQQRALDQPAASFFVQQAKSVTPTPLRPQLIVPPQADTTQVPASVWGTFAVMPPPLKGAVIGAPQADPTQIPAQIFHQEIKPLVVLSQLYGQSQADPSYYAALVFKQQPQGVQPYPASQFVVPPQADPSQPAARLVGTKPFVATPIHGRTLFGQPQADPSQPPATVAHQQPAQLGQLLQSIFAAGPQTDLCYRQPPSSIWGTIPFPRPALRGTLIGAPQSDPTQIPAHVWGPWALPRPPLHGIIFAQPQADPTQIPAGYYSRAIPWVPLTVWRQANQYPVGRVVYAQGLTRTAVSWPNNTIVRKASND